MIPDPRPLPRIVDPALMSELTDAGQEIQCMACGTRPTEPHHVRLKSQGGDDVEANIVFLCRRCHRAYHGNPYINDVGMMVDAGTVRFKLARWLETENGQATRAYLVGKIGRGAADRYLHKEFGIRT